MCRSTISRSGCPTAMRTVEPAALDLLLPAAAGERGELAPVAKAGRTIPEVAVLRQSSHGGQAGCESQAHPAADADSWNRSSLSETELEPLCLETRGLSVLASG